MLPIHNTQALPRVNTNAGLTPMSPSEGVVLPRQEEQLVSCWTQPAKGHLGQSHLLLLLPCCYCILGGSAKKWFCTHHYQAEVHPPDL